MKMIRRSLIPALGVFLLGTTAAQAELRSNVFGYLEGYWEKVEKAPTRTGGTGSTEGVSTRTKSPADFNTPNIFFMVKSDYKDKYSGYLNISGADGGTTSVQNAWVESKLFGDHLKFRFGKMYRKFGIYNEQLDAIPTYMGIEPPELFDGDHLLLSRTTDMMFHGDYSFTNGILKYALMAGDDEKFSDELPWGGDVRYNHFGTGFDILVGTSFYISKKSKPNSSLNGGVMDWMESDKYKVFGLYSEFNMKGLKVQGAYYQADHNAIRDGATVQSKLGSLTNLNTEQINRICQGDCSTAGSRANTVADYDVKTWYLRAGYSFQTSMGEFLPYVQWDHYSNPEMIAQKSAGGDNEAGLADDGKFNKQTLGMVFRPFPVVAFKLDASNHSQDIDGDNLNYSEIRFSYSYIWTL